jgi:hypothetical protein
MTYLLVNLPFRSTPFTPQQHATEKRKCPEIFLISRNCRADRPREQSSNKRSIDPAALASEDSIRRALVNLQARFVIAIRKTYA